MRRYFIPIGVPRPGQPLPNLPAVPTDVALLRDVFVDGLGYSSVPIVDNPSAAQVRQGLTRWLAGARLTRDDAVVIYYSGHGYVAPSGHYLYTRSFHKDAVADGLRSHTLIELLVGRKARPGKIWLILDCCHAGGILMSDLYRDLAIGHTDTFVLAASGSHGQAADGAFSGAFHDATRRLGGGASLDQITGTINARLAGARPGSPAIQFGFSSGKFDFLDDRGGPTLPRPASLSFRI